MKLKRHDFQIKTLLFLFSVLFGFLAYYFSILWLFVPAYICVIALIVISVRESFKLA